MGCEQRREWLWKLKPGDNVLVVHSGGDVRHGVVVETSDPLVYTHHVAVDLGYDRLCYYNRSSAGDIGGSTAHPHGLPATIGDQSYIFPHDDDPQESVDRLKLRYFFSRNPYLDLPIEAVRKILALIDEATPTEPSQ